MVELDSMPKDVGKGFIDDDPDAADGMLRLIMFTADGRTFEDAEVSGLAFIGGRFVGDLCSGPGPGHGDTDCAGSGW